MDRQVRLREKLQSLALTGEIVAKTAKFDPQAMANPEIAGIEYQRGTLAGHPARARALEKRGYKWIYRGTKEGKLAVDHLVPRAKGGSNRPSNLVIASVSGKRKKSDKPAKEFLAKEPEKLTRLQTQAKRPRKDATARNITRWALWNICWAPLSY
jgi:hypothetical protein